MLNNRDLFKKIISIFAVACVVVGGLSLFAVTAHAAPSSSLEVGLAQANFTGQANPESLPVTVAKIIRTALGLLGIVAVVLVLYGGFVYMTAGGNEEKVEQGKKILMNAGIGLIIILSAYGIVSFVMKSLVGTVNGGSSDLVTNNNGGNGGGDGGNNNAGFSQAFYVSSVPQDGPVCIKNIAPQIVFNKNVNLATVKDTVVVLEKSTNTQASGDWKYGATTNTIVFAPSESCAPAAGNDCFKANTDYAIEFKNPENIKSLGEPALSLNCRLKAGCRTVNFKSGDGVDRLPPTIAISYPENFAALEAGTVVGVKMTYNDDNGVQGLTLSSDIEDELNLINSASFTGCKKSDTATILWTTPTNNPGRQVLRATVTDWAGQTGKTSSNVILKPNHCYNGLVESNLGEEKAGPPECGGECGACSGAVCKTANDCASGDCVNGVCANIMRITGFSPSSGAPGTFVTVSGYYFGSKQGKVYFANKNNPDILDDADWVQAQLVNCDGASNNWNSGQVIVRVPAGAAASSHIKVESAPFIGVDGKQLTNRDATTKHNQLSPFVVNELVRPSICALSPSHGQIDSVVSIVGNGFGLMGFNNDKVTIGGEKVSIASDVNNQPIWSDARISAAVPVIGSGGVGVQVFKNNVESNSVRFVVDSGANGTLPAVTEISPANAPAGTYLTINGKNFGTKIGTVSFKATQTGAAILGDTTFPKECSATFWSDTKILVKFPVGKGTVGTSYAVQIKTADAKSSIFDTQQTYAVEAGDPAPGICAITPAAGPIPFPAGQTVQIFGDYFVTANNPTAVVYFWNPGALNPTSITGRNPVQGAGVVKISANAVTVVPPVGTIPGPVSVYRIGDTKISNPAQFNASNCTTNTSICGSNAHCCLNGSEAGICKANGSVCSNETVSTGYVWRFATKSIPPVPHVVERCDVSVASGESLPSPSPSAQWDNNNNQGDHHNVCRTALITVELSSLIDPQTIKADSVMVNRCSSSNGNDCVNPTPVALKEGSLELKTAFSNSKETHQYLSLQATEAWATGNWYQVILTNKIKSFSDAGKGIALAADKPCGTNGAYCFNFKSSGNECRLKNVVVTPYSYYTQVLEAPVRSHTSNGTGSPVDYRAGGLSDQSCVMMDVSTMPWEWETADTKLATIFGSAAGQKVNVEAKGNTVGVGVSDDSVIVTANTKITSAEGQTVKSGTSPLTVDLSNPQVVDYWPKCLEACTNAQVGVRFNVSMSARNLASAIEKKSIQLLLCGDENCSSTTEVGNSSDITLTNESSGTELQIANSSPTAKALQPGKLYQVVISSNSTNPTNDSSVLWSRARTEDASSYSKPLNKEFTWRFRTKNSDCKIDRAEVLPKEFVARLVSDKSIFTVQPYAAPDTCSAKGQKLNPWSVSWAWKSTDTAVASIATFSTRGKSQYCTASCVKKGSDIPSSVTTRFPVCGNDIVEAGEDCDAPNKENGCSLNCRFTGTAAPVCGNKQLDPGEACDASIAGTVGCSTTCLHAGSAAKTGAKDINAAICGNGDIGQGEDCDTGIVGDVISTKSSLYCTASCLHAGTTLSSDWCYKNKDNFGKFKQEDYKAACAKAYSRCGDGVQGPDEDVGCDLGDGKNAAWCSSYCIANNTSSGDKCDPTKEGCSAAGQNVGSSLGYTAPSVCGDEKVGTGEDAFCEQKENLTITHDAFFDPWTLALAVSKGKAIGTPPKQVTTISAATDQQTKGGQITGSGLFSIACGYRNDADCAGVLGAGYGVGNTSCCFVRGKVTETLPANNTTNVCRNTAIQATFNTVVDSATLSGNVLIARGITDNAICAAGTIDVTDLFDTQTSASVSKWCAGAEQAAAIVTIDPVNTSISHLTVSLNQALAPSSHYAVVLKDGIKDVQGVHLASPKGTYTWQFETAAKICEVDAVTVTPSSWSFTKAKDTKTLKAEAHAGGVTGPVIQPVPSVYSWNYNWQPKNGDFVTLESVVTESNKATANNRNGEVDVRAFATVVDNVLNSTKGVLANGSSHIIVNLCENVWPPLQVSGSGGGVLATFPFSDTKGNTSGFNLGNKTFNGSTIPPSSLTGDNGDGYFNFSTYYCADSGSTGTFDDLPYLQPAVQTAASSLKSDSGSCEVTGDSCKADSECGTYYTGATSFVVANNANSICAGSTTAGDVNNFFDNTTDPIGCIAAADCTRDDYKTWLTKNNYQPTCRAITIPTKRQLKCINNAPLKRFIFTNTNNSDAIGIQVFSNPEHLSPSQWYSNNKSAGGQGFVGTLKAVPPLAGYEAVSDGNNIYVSALNYSKDKQSLYSDIYLFSISQNAKSDTQNVFQQIISNLHFNTNIPYNDGYCGTTMNNPGSAFRCTSDLSCPTGQVCVNQVQKLKNNYQRYIDLKKIEGILDSYANQHSGSYPPVNVGSFLPGQTLSAWDWAGLASVVGQGLPKDPVEKLGIAGTCTKHATNGATSPVSPTTFCINDDGCNKAAGDTCTLHNATTGWSTDDRRFSFACPVDSYSYRYQVAGTGGFTMLSRFEDPGLTITNSQNFVDGFHFNNASRFKAISGSQNNICNKNGEVSTISAGTCGDGQVNVAIGEQCDPVNSVEYDRSSCNADGTGILKTKTCDAQCHWQTKTSQLSENACVDGVKCGNGRIDSGEKCDDGVQNGKWNKCTKLCAFPPNRPCVNGVCADTPPGPGYCGDKIIETANEICDSGHLETTCVDQPPTCHTEQVCQNKETCDKPKKCVIQGVMGNTVCTAISSCNGSLHNFQIFLTQGVLTQPKVTAAIDYVVIDTTRADVNTIVYSSAPASSYCERDGQSQSYKCQTQFAYKYGTCNATGHVDSALDLGSCANGLCKTVTKAVVSEVTGPASCMMDNKLEASEVTVTFKRWAVSCDREPGAICTTQPDPNNCQNQSVCVNNPQVCTQSLVDVGKPSYGKTKAESCSWDCQGYGPYCGDGVVQTASGEECDWNAKDTLTCKVGGISGKKTCSSSCKLSDAASSAWWGLDAASNNGQTFVDRDGTADASCQTASCPTFATNGSVSSKGTYRFDGNDLITANHADALMPTTVVSIEAWVKPEAGAVNFARVIEKGGYQVGGGYDLETNFKSGDATVNRVAFNVWGADGTTNSNAQVYSKYELPLSVWTHVVATYEYQPTTKKESLKIYINGKTTPDNEIVRTNITAPTMTKNTKPVTIGRGGAGGNFFVGSLNNIRVLNRVLQPSEVKDRFDNAWPCTIPAQSSVLTVAAGTCGDAHIDPSEVCDLGVLQNGKQCTPGYGQTCQFCSADCKSAQDVRSNQFCGDGVIQGTEVCETDQTTGDIYASAKDTVGTAAFPTNGRNGYKVLQCNQETAAIGIFKKGTKVCSTDCKRLAVQETNALTCVSCGVDNEKGVSVAGSFINVLETNSTMPLDPGNNFIPLWRIMAVQGTTARVVAANDQVASLPGTNYDFIDGNSIKTLFNSDQICSNNIGFSYKLNVNNVSGQYFDFSIKDKPETWQYDMPISPMISEAARPNDIRFVVSWVGETDFSVGLVRPGTAASSLTIEDAALTLRAATGLKYYEKPRSDIAAIAWNIWYHGQGKTVGGLTEEAFTIDTSKMSDASYMVYVRTPVPPMKSFRNTANLKVDVYIPKAEGSYSQLLSQGFVYPQLPTKTFYLNKADVSTNATAAYWHVFTINKNGTPAINKIGNAALFDPGTDTRNENYDNGRIVTGVEYMY